MASQHSTTADFSSRYKFNGKELDRETGWYYYGARYYDPQGSTWLSVDPLAEKYIGFSPYNFTLGNPVKLVDPDGRGLEDEWIVFSTGETKRVGDKGGDKTDYITKVNDDGSISTIEQAAGYMKETGYFNTEEKNTTKNPMTNKEKALAYSDSLQKFQDDLGDTGDMFFSDFDTHIPILKQYIIDGNKEKALNALVWEAVMDDKVGFAMSGGGRKAKTTKSRGSRVRTTKTKRATVNISGVNRTVHTGPRGGKYYINKNGNKTYLNRDGTKKKKKK